MKKFIRWMLFSLVSLAGVGLVIAGLQLGWFDGWVAAGKEASAKPPVPTSATQNVRVETVLPSRRTSVQPAHVEALERVEIVPKITGYLEALGKDLDGKEIDTGSRIRPGQVLAIISAPEMEKEWRFKDAVAKEAEASVLAMMKRHSQAEKDLGKYRAEMAYWDEEIGRYEDLFKRNTIEESLLKGKRNLHLAARSALESAEEKVAQLKEDLLVAQAHVNSAKFDAERVAELYKYRILQLSSNTEHVDSRTSAAGSQEKAERDKALYIVTRRWADPGAYVQSGSGAQRGSLLSLSRVDRVKIVADLPELDCSRVQQGDSAVFRAIALPHQAFNGKISRLSSTLDPQTRTMRVEIDVPNPDGGPLYPGMYGSATVLLSEQQGILMIPSSCVRKERESFFVYCVEEGRAKKVPVTVGMDDGNQVEVLKGVQPDSQVIRLAHGALKDGQPVTAK